MANQNFSHMEKKTEKSEIVDPCPICSKDLYLDDTFTQRVGLLGDADDVIGWLCPHCRSEFDVDEHLTRYKGKDGMTGEA